MSPTPSSEPKVDTTAFTTLLTTYPPTHQVHMLNLLRFRPTAIYNTETADTLPSNSAVECTGRSAYHDRYLPAVRPILAEIGAEIVFHGKSWEGLNLIQGGEAWDEVMIVRYPNLETFKDLAGSERYMVEAGVHRIAALGGMGLVPLGAL